MKKIFIAIALLITTGCAYGACDNLNCVEPYDLSSSFSRFFSVLSGQKFLNEKLGESLLKRVVKKNIINGKIKTEIKSFSGRDLKEGRFKSAKITGKDINIQGIHISSFEAETLCNFNYITEDKNGDLFIKENMPLKVTVIMSEDDMNNTMASTDYKRIIDNINNFGGNFSVLNVESTKVQIKDNKMYYVLTYSLPFVRKSKEIMLSADLKVTNGQIQIANTKLENSGLSLDIDRFSKILNYLNPLDFSSKILENKEARYKIEHVNISDNKVMISGIITILKDKEK
jgi:hypothetical protein